MFDVIKNFINELANAVWGLPLVAMLLFVGILYSVKSRFFQIIHFKDIWRETFGSLVNKSNNKSGINAFKAMSVALGGTIGIGNIVGVATALTIGGPGSVFWMWVSGFVGMITKFAEVCLSVKYRKTDKKGNNYGGPMVYITETLGKKFAPFSTAFSIFCILASFGIGNLTQVNSISLSIESAFNLPTIITGFLIAIPVLLVVIGGIGRVSNFTGIFVPIMSLLYILGSIYVIFVNSDNLLVAFTDIFDGAFGFNQAAGGAAGFSISRAIRVGVSRGVFTHEAGMGSSPIAHASSKNATPAIQGMWGMVEVFIDTIIVCTVTALAILSSNVFRSDSELSGIKLTTAVFTDVFGPFGSKFIAISVTLFAFASIVCWAFYGQSAVEFLFHKNKSAIGIYNFIFFAFMIIGANADISLVWGIADIFNGLMALPNIITITILYPSVVEEINKYKCDKIGSCKFRWDLCPRK